MASDYNMMFSHQASMRMLSHTMSSRSDMSSNGRLSISRKSMGLEKEIQEMAVSGHRAAILLLDFQNEFVKKGGKLHDGVAETMEANGILKKVPKLVDVARKTNAMIIYSPVVMKERGKFEAIPEEESIEVEEPGKRRVSFRKKGQKYTEMYGLFTENTWNCEIAHEVEPKDSDVILQDRCDFNAFAGTDLLSHLRENNVTHFFVTGFLTDACVYQTATKAADLLEDVTTYVISDCCAANSIEEHSDALKRLGGNSSSVRIVKASEAETLLTDCANSGFMNDNDREGNEEEWIMIDKIFAVGDTDESGTIDAEKLLSLISNTLEPDSAILSTLSENLKKGTRDSANVRRGSNYRENGIKDAEVSREDMHRILFQRKPRTTFLEKLQLFIVVIYMPFLYSISTRIPFIFVALEMIEARGRQLWEVGLVLGVYQTSRACGNLLIVTFGGKNPFKRLQLPLIVSAIFGWLFLTLYERPSTTRIFDFQPYFEDGDGIIWPLFFLLFVGLCETIVILQRAIMIETAKESPSGIIDELTLTNRFSLQYALVSFGSVVAFIVGGWVYTNKGFYAVCDVGILVQFAHLFGAVLYIVLDKESKRSVKSVDDMDGNDLIRSVIYRFQALSEISKYSRGVTNGSEGLFGSGTSGLSAAAIKAKGDRVLNHSLSELFRHFFNNKSGLDDNACFEKLLAASTADKSGSASLDSRRPLAMSIGKQKLSELVLFLMKSHDGGRERKLTEGEFVRFWAPRLYLSMFESSQESVVTVIWPYMKAVVATQAIAALCIGIFLSTALLSYSQRFGVDAAQVGLLLGIGEAIGSLVIFLKTFVLNYGGWKTDGNLIGKAIVSRPLNVPAVLIFSGICSMLFSVNNFWFAVVCQIMYSSVNDLSVSLMNELIGTSLPPNKFKQYQGMGQWLRRLGNMLTAILGPIFFGFYDGLPFLLFGAIVIVWALILWSLMHAHANRISMSAKIEDDDKGEKGIDNNTCLAESALVEPFVPFFGTSRTPWHLMEQRYYAKNKDRIDEKLNTWEKASVDISLMEHQIRSLAAALEVEKHQRRALEDRMYARTSMGSNEPKIVATNEKGMECNAP